MSEILSLLSGGLVGGFVGAFLGGFAKFFWENWLPARLTWRREQTVEREKLLSQYRAPAMRAIFDLQSRLYVILLTGNRQHLYAQKNGPVDYYIFSTAYLLAQYFAWAEILRAKIAVFDYAILVEKIEAVTRSFSRGRPGFQMLRLQQQEIGERMLQDAPDANPRCLSYAEFGGRSGGKSAPACFVDLIKTVRTLMKDWRRELVRLTGIQHALIDLAHFIDPKGMWTPKGEGRKFDLAARLEELLAEEEINRKDYDDMFEEARRAGLITGRTLQAP